MMAGEERLVAQHAACRLQNGAQGRQALLACLGLEAREVGRTQPLAARLLEVGLIDRPDAIVEIANDQHEKRRMDRRIDPTADEARIAERHLAFEDRFVRMGLVEMLGDRPAVLHHRGSVVDNGHGLRLGEGNLLLFGEAHRFVTPAKALVLQSKLRAPAEWAGAAVFAEDEVVECDHLPSSILMMPEKSLAALPLLVNKVKSCAASAPSGVDAP